MSRDEIFALCIKNKKREKWRVNSREAKATKLKSSLRERG